MPADIRTSVTKNIMKESLMKSLQHKEVNNITVQMLCAEAGISRTTFYRYYQCVDDLIEEIEKNCVSELSQMVRKEHGAETDTILLNLLEKIKMAPNYLRIGFYDADRFNRLIEDDLYPYVKQIMSEPWKKKSEEQKHILFDFIVYGVNGIIKEWIESGFTADPKIIVAEIKSIKF